MKKIFTTVITLCLCVIFCSTVYAMSPEDLTGLDEDGVYVSEVYDLSEYDFEYVSDTLKQYCINQYKTNGERLIWTVSSLNNHQDVQYQIYSNEAEEAFCETLKTLDESCDFIQINSIINEGNWSEVRDLFELDPANAMIDIVIPIESHTEEVLERFKKTPVYWNLERSKEGIYVLEAATGKYEIQPGDTLSEIALKNNTSIEKLMEDNQNISNPDLIYAGDYLVIE